MIRSKVEKIAKNNQKVKNCFQGDMKSWKKGAKCWKVEKSVEKLKKMQTILEKSQESWKKRKKLRKLEKFRKIEKKSKKVRQNHQKSEKFFWICRFCAKKWLWECQKVNVLTYLSRKSLKSEKWCRKSFLAKNW